jgi:broad specificity phosphatase PhoE
MRLLEHRRHSMRDPASPHLSTAGVALAQRVASSVGPFDRVVTSPKPRAVETAVAMGFPVDAELEELSVMPDDLLSLLDALKPRSFADYAALVGRYPAMAEYAHGQEALWRRELKRVPDGGRLLIVSHGGVIESGAVMAAPSSAEAWGPALGYLEGIRLYRDGDRWIRAEVVRVGP